MYEEAPKQPGREESRPKGKSAPAEAIEGLARRRAHAERLLRRLEAIESHGRTGHQQHTEYAQRLHQLARRLRAVLQLYESRHYASALVVVRAALEHHFMDRLILLANRHIVTYTKAKKKGAAKCLALLEGALSPKAATLLWLEEAQQFPSLPAYVGWLIDQPISAAPLERVPAQARAAAVEALREAAHQAVRDAVFLTSSGTRRVPPPWRDAYGAHSVSGQLTVGSKR